jgi:hypothetical protein
VLLVQQLPHQLPRQQLLLPLLLFLLVLALQEPTLPTFCEDDHAV